MDLSNRTVDFNGGWMTGPTHAMRADEYKTLCGINTGNPLTQCLWNYFDFNEGVVGCERCKRIIQNQVAETNEKQCWDYDYQAKYISGSTIVFLAGNSLTKLKKEIKNRGWDMAWITTRKGCFSYGQNLVDEYPYSPRY